MEADNPTWGAPRIHGELKMLGLDMIPACGDHSLDPWPTLAPENFSLIMPNKVTPNAVMTMLARLPCGIVRNSTLWLRPEAVAQIDFLEWSVLQKCTDEGVNMT